MSEPLVSIVMGIHNEKEEYLCEAIDSIRNQTYPHIELILIDDASDEGYDDFIKKCCHGMSNVKLLRNEKNIGLTKSLNKGLAAATGEFIARMDADDISLPERIEKQVKFLTDNPDISIVGTGVISFGEGTIFMSPAFGYNNNECQCSLFFSSTLCHPSVMMRRSFLKEHDLTYDENVKKGQDYDMWERCSVYGKLAVMSDVLLYYRIHAAQITSTNRGDQNSTADIVRKRRIGRLGIVPTEKEFSCHKLLASGRDKSISEKDIKEWIEKILASNKELSLVNEDTLKHDLNTRLVLYKLRNRKFIYAPKELLLLCHTILSRTRAKRKLVKEKNKFANKN